MLNFSFDSVIRIPVPDWIQLIIAYVSYLFVFELLYLSTITTYLAGLQHVLVTTDVPRSVWSPALHQTMRGFRRDETLLFKERKQIKIPFTRPMIKIAFERLLLKFYGPDSIISVATHAALCMGLMFLFRKSEFLTGANRKLKFSNGLPVTLLARNVQVWYDDDTSFTAAQGQFLPSQVPVFLSIFLEATKNDQFGKGAQRFFPADPTNPDCMVKVVFRYLKIAGLREDDPIFGGPLYVVTDSCLADLLKATCVLLGIRSDLCSLHSLRVGGLVTLFAADVPDSLKQLAGRWSSPTSFVVYARATIVAKAGTQSPANGHACKYPISRCSVYWA